MRRTSPGHGVPNIPFMQRSDRLSKSRAKPEWVVFRDAAPYPEVGGPPDADTVEMLKQDYAGSAGELSGITQYVYQSIAAGAKSENESFANALLQIAIVEMMHLDMLGDAIVTLGGDPRFSDGQRYWSASDIDYSTSFEDMVRANIEAEQDAIANYKKHASLTGNKMVRDFLLRIAEDEKLHLHFFRKLLRPSAPNAPMDDRYERT
ncbi:MAG: manganese catalase family protein [Clostridia bacterium]|nr:manganese catalase family protein [Clostridia bacterium]